MQTVAVENRIDLDAAAEFIAARRRHWQELGITASDTTWRDQGRGWPPPITTQRSEVVDPDSIGVALRKGSQEGSVVLFRGGWADFLYWDGAEEVIDEAPGYGHWLNLDAFGSVLDPLTTAFR